MNIIRLVASLCVLVAALSTAAADPKLEAKARIESAMVHHGNARYAAALADLTAAYELDPQTDLLFAIAQVHVKLDRCADAIPYYEKFIAAKPGAGPEAAAREAITVCKAKLPAEPKPEPTPPPTTGTTTEPTTETTTTVATTTEPAQPLTEPPPMRDEPRAWFKDPVGGALVGVGVAGVVVGAVLYTGARGKLDDAENADTYEQSEALIDDARSTRTIAAIAGIGGVVLIGAGVTRYIMVRGRTREEATLGVVPTRGGAAITFGGSF